MSPTSVPDPRRATLDRYMAEHWGESVALARRILGNTQDAEDAVMDAALRAVKGLAAYDAAQSFEAWFRRILVNAALKARQQRAGRPQALPADECDWQLVSAEPGPMDVALAEAGRRELTMLVALALGRLRPVEAQAIRLTYLAHPCVPTEDGLPLQRDVAERMGLSYGALRARLSRARGSFATAFTQITEMRTESRTGARAGC